MAETVRIDPQAHETLAKLARLSGTSMTDVLRKALASYERELFIAGLAADFAALSPEERAEEAAEVAVWDATLSDGLESE